MFLGDPYSYFGTLVGSETPVENLGVIITVAI